MAASVHPRSLRNIVIVIVGADTPISYSNLSTEADLTPRHLTNCMKVLIDQQHVISRTRDPDYAGRGIRYIYDVDLSEAIHYGYLKPEAS